MAAFLAQAVSVLGASLFFLCLGEKVDEVLLPHDGLGMGSVAASGIGDRNEDELSVGQLCDHFFCDA